MTHRRPTVALHISTPLFRDALSRALHPHADVVIAPDCDVEYAQWVEHNGVVDLAIVSGVDRIIDLEARVVIDVPPADGQPPVGLVRGGETTVGSLEELLGLVGRVP